jgi:alpha-tubulin suppressor-like RCC1 family protein
LTACGDDQVTAPDLKSTAAAPLTVAPTALEFIVPPGGSATLTARVQFVGVISAVSSDQACATVSPANVPATKPRGSSQYVATFTVTAMGSGNCTITVTDKKGRTAVVPVTIAQGVVTLRGQTLAAQESHACGLDRDGLAYCWGENFSGELGDGTLTSRASPTPVVNVPVLTAITVGYQHSCALAASGQAYCWGQNLFGQLGDGTTTSSLTASPVQGTVRFAAVVAGANNTCGLTAGGSAYCWGINSVGELGDGSSTNRSVPTPVAGSHVFTTIGAGPGQICGTTTGGISYCWGSNQTGQLGDGTDTDRSLPTAISGTRTYTSFAGGQYHTCALDEVGLAYCWGNNVSGELGTGVVGVAYAGPQPVVGPNGGPALAFIALAAGAQHTCGRAVDGRTYCWGRNSAGELGDGTSVDRSTPTAVSGSLDFVRLAGGTLFSCGVTTDGVGKCWGSNGNGRLGTGSAGVGHLTPATVAGDIVFRTE